MAEKEQADIPPAKDPKKKDHPPADTKKKVEAVTDQKQVKPEIPANDKPPKAKPTDDLTVGDLKTSGQPSSDIQKPMEAVTDQKQMKKQQKEPPMNDTNSPTQTEPQKQSGRSIGDLKVNVSVQICQLNLPLKEILSLEPGKLLKLENDPNAPISLVVNGKVLAKAELVYLGDKLGLRILQFV